MKKIAVISGVFILTVLSFNLPYKDGNYHGSSRASYNNEPYYGFARIRVENGQIVKVVFFVRDSAKQEIFDGKYERHFAGNDLYVQQCRNDWKGIQSYPDSLLKYQDIDQIDAISGATWSYNLFKASVKEAFVTSPGD